MKNTLLLLISSVAVSNAAVVYSTTYANNSGSGSIFADGVAIGTFTVTTPYNSVNDGVGVAFNGSQTGTSVATTVSVSITDSQYYLVSMDWGANDGAGALGIGGGSTWGVALDTDATVSTSVGTWTIGGSAITTATAYTADDVLSTGGIVANPHVENAYLFAGAVGDTQTLTYTTDTNLAQEQYYVNFNLDVVPEPTSAALLGLGGLALLARRKR